MIVLDASVLVELLLNTADGRRLVTRITPPELTLHAPHLVDLEVAQVLRRYVQQGSLSRERGRLAVEHLSQLPMTRYGHRELMPRIWALRHNLTAYDAAYVVLAEALGATLITGDRRLARSAGHRADIEML